MKRVLCPSYLVFIHEHRCVSCGAHGVQAHHCEATARMRGSDLKTLPVCGACHIQSPKRCNEAIGHASGESVEHLIEYHQLQYIETHDVPIMLESESFEEMMLRTGRATIAPSKNRLTKKFIPLNER